MANVLRAFQVLNDGGYVVNSTYNKINADGNIVSSNVKDSFYATDPELQAHIDAIKNYIMTNRLNEA